jgi:quercetin dioxygenase-like cupin family protein
MNAMNRSEMSLVLSSCAAVVIAVAGCHADPPPPAAAAQAASGGERPPLTSIRRTLIRREPAHESGWETRIYLVEYPPGAVATPHIHPAVGVGWVVEGEFESAFGDGPVVKVKAGEGFTDPAEVVHRFFRNPSPDHEMHLVVAYTIRENDEQFRPAS